MVLLILAFLGSVPAFADCPVSGTSVADTFSHIPVRNQGSAFICNAEATASVVDYWRCKRQADAGHPELCNGPNGMAGNATSAVSLFSAGYVQTWGSRGEKRPGGGAMDSESDVPGNDPDVLFRSVFKTPPVAACSISGFERSMGDLSVLAGDDRPFWQNGGLSEEQIMGKMALKRGNPQGTNDCSIQGIFRDWYEARCGFLKSSSRDMQEFYFWNMGSTNLGSNITRCFPTAQQDAERNRIRTLMESVLPTCGKYTSSDDAWSQLWPSVMDRVLARSCSSTSLSSQMGTGLSVTNITIKNNFNLQMAGDGKHFSHASMIEPPAADIQRVNNAMRNALTGHVPVVLRVCYSNVFHPSTTPQTRHCNGETADDFNNRMATHTNPSQQDLKDELRNSLPVGHALVLVGSAEHAGKCQYMVRNSYGNNCAGGRQRCGQCPEIVDPWAQCSQAERGANGGCCTSEKYPSGCCDMQGNQWIDQSVLEMNVQGVTGMTPEGTAL